jgi:ribA/ribD-fused uncharacterized protein
MENPLSFTFFWRGPLSNWHKSTFDGLLWDEVQRRFCTTEQWMMSAKALLFSDLNALQAIMATNDPKEQKALGRQVSGFNKAKWDLHARNLVYAGCSYKFEQNPRLKEILLATKGVLAEASPYDKVWGIGLDEKDPRARNPGQWQGTNWLGQVLMHVRKDLKDPLSVGVKAASSSTQPSTAFPAGTSFCKTATAEVPPARRRGPLRRRPGTAQGAASSQLLPPLGAAPVNYSQSQPVE